MILYENTVKNFIYAMKGRNLISYISDEYNSRVGRKISQETKNAWKYSLEVLKQIVVESEVQDDCGIRIDYVILGNAKRFEVIIVGENEQGKLIHVIDLLPWENVSKTDELDMVEFDAGDDEIKKCVHPSYQSISYKKYLPKKNQNIDIYSYVYLFECDKNEETISIVNSYKMLTDEAPIYFAEDQDIVINRLSSFKNCYNGREILNLFHERDQLSSEGVDAFLSGILSDEEIGMLTDDQKTVLVSVIKKSEENVNALLLVEGAPGTGKTMLSISCILELVKRDKKVAYLTPTMVQCEMLRNKISEKSDMTNVVDIDVIPRFRINQTRNNKKYDVVFVDESQTLVSKLNSDDKMESINLNTILKSANIVVCLYSSLQIFYGEIMEGIVLKKIAEKNNKAFSQYNLTSNIRYSGRGSGVSWLSHQFQIMDTGNYEDWDSDCFEISVADTPQVLIERLETKSNEGYSAKILVNYRKISDLQHDDDCEYPYYIISGEDYKIPVCTLQSGKTQEWIKDNRFIKYAAGPQVVQGLEFDYVGVIIGKELAFNPESGEIYAIENELDDPQFLKRVYYMLMSRGMKGIVLYIEDIELRTFICNRLEYSTRRFSWIKELAEKYTAEKEKEYVISQKKNNSYSYVLQIYEAINNFVAELKQLSEAQLDESEYKMISDKCSDLLLKLQSVPMSEHEIADKYKKIIVNNMGQSAWNKLSENGRKCLISSELTYHDMKDYNQLYDFSAVCVQVSKAVEFEITKRYYEYYVDYLKNKYEKKEYSDEFLAKLPDAIKKKERNKIRLLKETEVMLGTIPFIVGLNVDGIITDQTAYDSFIDYATNILLVELNNPKEILGKHIKYIVRIKNDYRNKAAHKTPMDAVSAKACLDYVIEVQRTLGQILDDCKK